MLHDFLEKLGRPIPLLGGSRKSLVLSYSESHMLQPLPLMTPSPREIAAKQWDFVTAKRYGKIKGFYDPLAGLGVRMKCGIDFEWSFTRSEQSFRCGFLLP